MRFRNKDNCHNVESNFIAWISNFESHAALKKIVGGWQILKPTDTIVIYMWTCKLKGKLQTNTFAISFGSRDRLKPSWFTRQCSLTCQKRRSKGQQRTMLWFWWWKKSSRMASWQATTPYFWFSLQTWAMAIHRRGFRQFLIVIMWNKFSCWRLTIHKAKQKFEPSSLILWLHS